VPGAPTDCYDASRQPIFDGWTGGAVQPRCFEYATLGLSALLGASLPACGDEVAVDGPAAHAEAEASGCLLVREQWYRGADGTVQKSVRYGYDAAGRLTSREEECEGDDSCSVRVQFTYDAKGNLQREEGDYDGDGTFEVRTDHVYGTSGQRLVSQFERTDSEGSPLAYTTWYSYDTEGRLVREEREDQVRTPLANTDYVYDSSGRLVRVGYDSNGDDVPDEIVVHTYDAAGKRVLTEVDADGDGAVERRTSFVYDTAGNLARWETDVDGDGAADEGGVRTYDDVGNLVGEEQDWDVDGVVDWRGEYFYDCPEGS